MRKWLKGILKSHYTMRTSLMWFVFLVLAATTLIIAGLAVFLIKLDILAARTGPRYGLLILIIVASSLVLGTAFSALIAKWELDPYKKLIAATKRIAAGDFDARVLLDGPKEVEEMAQSFNNMAQELGSIEALRANVISNVSHEFKTPIVSIRGMAKLLKKDSLSAEDRQEYLDVIVSESDRLSKLSEKILLLSKLESQSIPTQNTCFFIDEQLRRVVLLLESEWTRKKLQLSIQLDKIALVGKEDILYHVWTNLLDNAIKFSDVGGTITIAAYKSDDGVTVEITDNGIGMLAETASHIFDKFYQADISHSTAGNGLGLPLVKKIVELHHGAISVKSRTGAGTSFYISLPSGAKAPSA